MSADLISTLVNKNITILNVPSAKCSSLMQVGCTSRYPIWTKVLTADLDFSGPPFLLHHPGEGQHNSWSQTGSAVGSYPFCHRMNVKQPTKGQGLITVQPKIHELASTGTRLTPTQILIMGHSPNVQIKCCLNTSPMPILA